MQVNLKLEILFYLSVNSNWNIMSAKKVEINFERIATSIVLSIFKIFIIKLVLSLWVKTLKEMAIVLNSSNDLFEFKQFKKY